MLTMEKAVPGSGDPNEFVMARPSVSWFIESKSALHETSEEWGVSW